MVFLFFVITAVSSLNSENMLSTDYLLCYCRLTLFHLCLEQIFFKLNIISYRFWHSEDRASWYILIIKTTRCTNFSNLFLE